MERNINEYGRTIQYEPQGPRVVRPSEAEIHAGNAMVSPRHCDCLACLAERGEPMSFDSAAMVVKYLTDQGVGEAVAEYEVYEATDYRKPGELDDYLIHFHPADYHYTVIKR